MKNKNRDNRPTLQKALQRLTAVSSILMLFLAGLALSFNWGVEIVSLFTIAAYFFGLTYVTLPAFFSSFGTKLFGASFLALFTAPLIIYSIIVIIGMINIRNTLLIVADSRTWIMFAGSVIGGLMTMLAMYFSIKSSENTTRQQIEKINEQMDKNKTQFEKQLSLNIDNERNRLFPYFKCKFRRDQYIHSRYFDLDILNISPNPIQNLLIKEITSTINNVTLKVT